MIKTPRDHWDCIQDGCICVSHGATQSSVKSYDLAEASRKLVMDWLFGLKYRDLWFLASWSKWPTETSGGPFPHFSHRCHSSSVFFLWQCGFQKRHWGWAKDMGLAAALSSVYGVSFSICAHRAWASEPQLQVNPGCLEWKAGENQGPWTVRHLVENNDWNGFGMSRFFFSFYS
jgi:hypothetical protein